AVYCAADRLTLPLTSAVVCVAEALGRNYPRRALVIPNGIELDHFDPSAVSATGMRQRWGLDAGPVLGFVGRLTPQKDPLTFLHAVAEVRRHRPNVKALVVGDGPLRGAVEAEIARLELRSSCRLTGMQAEVAPLLGAMDVFVLSSVSEGFPFVVLEAMAMEQPAVWRPLRHGGAADAGAWGGHDGARSGLGMTRLAIIDLVTGRQPMTSPDGQLHVVFNGEIYNFRELRTRFAAAGRSFATTSDTEVILAAYERHGDLCVEHLRGMFAFALWDARRRRLLLARDRLGKKPLYYWRGDGVLLFASEIKALLCHPRISRAVDWESLHHYLAFGYTPADRSMFAGIAKLPPGHLLRVDATGAVERASYWSLPDAAATEAARVTAKEAPALVRHELREAVRLRLESDVPLGVFL